MVNSAAKAANSLNLLKNPSILLKDFLIFSRKIQ